MKSVKQCDLWNVMVIVVLFMVQKTSAAGLSVTPSRLEAIVTASEPHTVSLMVENPTSEVALIEVYPDSFQNLITAEPKSFTLESNTDRKVAITITAENQGTFTTVLSVVSRPLGDRSFKAGAGIKIPLQVEAREQTQKWPDWMIAVAVLDAILLALLIIYISKKRLKKK